MHWLAPIVLLAASAGGWLTVVAPLRSERDRVRAEYARVRQERERLRALLGEAERRAQVARTPADAAAAGRVLRRAFLRATDGLHLEAVQIAVSGDRRLGTRGRLSAEGGLAELLRLTDRLADPGSGVRIERVGLARTSRDSARRIEVEGVRTETSP